MKSAVIVALALLIPALSFASPKPVACGTHEQNILKNAEELYAEGAISGIEFARTKIKTSKALVACGTISSADACRDQAAVANDIIETVEKSVNAGDQESIAYDKVVVDFTALVAPCTL